MDDPASTDDIAALRRTVRRCTAVLVVAIGIHLATVTPGPSNWGLLLATVAGLYLFASVTDVEGDAAGTDGDETDGGDEHEEGSAVRSDAGG
ncbi:hypothetical protein [Halosimplex marinum]|uniref:hypothetical protein n=1 Tax=Halosimplex marinum TaxID=3396620 RepID=UPI003F54F14A